MGWLRRWATADKRKSFYDMMKAGKGEYDKRDNVWQFRPPSEDLFIRVDQSIRRTFQERQGGWSLRLPPGEEARIEPLIIGWTNSRDR
jgi:hypothetical protein